jgi:ATP-dependent helicase/nuclease subunit A
MTGLNYLAATAPDAPHQAQETFDLLRELHACRHNFSVAGFVEHVFARSRIAEAFFASQPDGAQCVANLSKALELARQLEGLGVRSLRAFVRSLRETVLGGIEEQLSPASEEGDDNVVRLLTMHKAKGLEFPVVVLPDLAGRTTDSGAKLLWSRDGECQLRFAGRRTTGFDDMQEDHKKREEAEEIRLLYVAATRAKERLVIPWFAAKGGRIDLLARGFVPAASALVEVPDLQSLPTPNSRPATKRGSVDEWIARRRAWTESRAELLARAAKPLARISPSKLAAEAEAGEDEPLGRERESAMEFGVVVHGALETVDLKATAAQQRGQIEQYIAQTGLSEDDKHGAIEMIGQALRSDVLARARQAEQVYRELPFAQVVDKGLMEGKIDLLFSENGRWVLVDYKTDARVEAGKYGEQLRAYEAALQQVAGITLAQKMLFFLATGAVEQVT